MTYSRQGRAIVGRKTFNPADTSKPPYYPKKTQGIVSPPGLSQEVQATQATSAARLRLEMSPSQYYWRTEIPWDDFIYAGDFNKNKIGATGGNIDPLADDGIPEGKTNVEGFPITANFDDAGAHFGKGSYGKGLLSLAKGVYGFTPPMMAYNVLNSTAIPLAKKGTKELMGLLGLGGDSPPAGINTIGGVDVSLGTQGPAGLAAVEGAMDAGGLPGTTMGADVSPLGVDAGIGAQGPMGLASVAPGSVVGGGDLADIAIGGGDGGDGGDDGDSIGIGPSTGAGGPDGGGGYGF